MRLLFTLALCVASCSTQDTTDLGPDAATPDEAPQRADALALADLPYTCKRDAECDGVAATCDPVQHVCLMRCPTVTIDSPAALASARRCREIDGDLMIRRSQLLVIGANDLPYLEHISGSLICAGGKPLRELTLPALRVVGSEMGGSLIEIALDSESLTQVSMPRLRTVHGSIGMFGLFALTDLNLGALKRVEETLALTNLPRLTTLSLDPELYVGDSLQLQFLCNLSGDALSPPTSAEVKAIGCCTEHGIACENIIACGCPK